ncbi:hypothetical protein ABIF15_007472 [Bradyrhizobium elkanii]
MAPVVGVEPGEDPDKVLLPQPDGPNSTPTSPAFSVKVTLSSTSCRFPAALSKLLPVILTSSCTEPPPR